jgi:hypothetical protein
LPVPIGARTFAEAAHPSVRHTKGKTVKSRVHVVAGIALVVGSLVAGTAGIAIAKSHNDGNVLRADTLFPVDTPFRNANAIRGVTGAGAAWVIADSEVRLRADGRLKVEVEGLVLLNTGVNPAALMRAVVSCETTDGTAVAPTSNVSSEPFAVDPAGNGELDTTIMLPSPCVAPIIFVVNNGYGAWFAVTGV